VLTQYENTARSMLETASVAAVNDALVETSGEPQATATLDGLDAVILDASHLIHAETVKGEEPLGSVDRA
jgi:hypothetical protein